MIFIDTHTHLYLDEFKGDRKEVMQRAIKQGVLQFYLPAIDSSETENMLALEKDYPQNIFAMAGLHPCSVKENYKEEIEKIEHAIQQRQFAAFGETGLDFYWDTTFKDQQYESLKIHAQWAVKYKRPLVLHTRNATQETIDFLKALNYPDLYGIFHCFGGTLQNAEEIIELGFVLGIGGVLTFKNSGLAEVVKKIKLEHLVLETDAPYLAPHPFRGKRNESSYIKIIAEKLAEIKNISVEKIAEVTTNNALKIFS